MSVLKKILLYSTPQGKVNVEVFFNNDTFWLTQKAMAQLFGVAVPAISKHLKNIFGTGELQQQSVISILETTATDGKNYKTTYPHSLSSSGCEFNWRLALNGFNGIRKNRTRAY
jgi:hypothetical protein